MPHTRGEHLRRPHRARGRGGRGGGRRGRGGRGGPPLRAVVPSLDTTPSIPNVDFEGDFNNFNIFAGQFERPARAKLRRARGNISMVARDEDAHIARPRVASRGLGYSKSTPRTDHAFQVWEASRPLLQPVKFVPAKEHPKLFERADDILKAHQQRENDHVPTSKQVDQIFHRASSTSPVNIGIQHLTIGTVEDGIQALFSADRITAPPDHEPQVFNNGVVTVDPDQQLKSIWPADDIPSEEDDIIVYRPPVEQKPDFVSFSEDTQSADVLLPLSSAPESSLPPKHRHSLEDNHLRDHLPHFRRANGSDIDWGEDTDSDGRDLDCGDMLDPDLDHGALLGFLGSVQSMQGANQVTIDDLLDAERLRAEDEVDDSASSESEDELGQILIGPNDIDSEDSPSDSGSLSMTFDERLKKIRLAQQTGDGDLERLIEGGQDFASESSEDELINDIQQMIDGGGTTVAATRKAHLKALRKGLADKIPEKSLLVQWGKDRTKKAEHKRLRQIDRIQQAGFSKPIKNGKKNKYDLVQAGLLDPETAIPDGRTTLEEVESRIRTFVEILGGPESLILPPMDKATRTSVHQLAEAFHLKSKSRGKGEARFTTLFKTSRTGTGIKHWKVNQVVHGKFGTGPKKHREGDEVGKSAPRIGEGNVGFKMLQHMGWEEGQGIGVGIGLEVPLIAKIKNTKLGLGASR